MENSHQQREKLKKLSNMLGNTSLNTEISLLASLEKNKQNTKGDVNMETMQKICQMSEVTLVIMSGVAFAIWVFGWAAKMRRLEHEVKHLRKLLTKVCNGWSADAEEVSAEILNMQTSRLQRGRRIMVRRVSDCVSCGFPCKRKNCPHYEQVEKICDCCGEFVDTLYWFDGEQYCGDCILKQFDEVSDDDED